MVNSRGLVSGNADAVRRKLSAVIKRLEHAYGRPKVKPQAEPLGALVKTILSQNTSDLNSDRAYASLREAFPVWEKLLTARPARVERAIRRGGLAKQKAGRILAILKKIKRERGRLSLRFIHKMETQAAVAWLIAFKGIGLKTACVVLAFACARDIFPVDTHVERVSQRLGLVPAKASADKVHLLLDPVIPKGRKQSLHLNMIRLGRELCKAQRTKCQECFLRQVCGGIS